MSAARLTTALALAAGLMLGACGSAEQTPGSAVDETTTAAGTGDSSDSSEETTVTTPGDESPTTLPVGPEAGSLPLGPVPEQVVARPAVQAAVADMAERADVPVDEVTVAGYADVTWPDGAIGCPQPGMMYTQALVPGHQLVLQVGDTLASYHAAEGKDFAYCASPQPPLPGDSGTR
jgi:hypothetical protein